MGRQKTCPTSKIRHGRRRQAELHMYRLFSSTKVKDKMTLHVYRCVCGSFHVGHDAKLRRQTAGAL
jgi:hypothetical protein